MIRIGAFFFCDGEGLGVVCIRRWEVFELLILCESDSKRFYRKAISFVEDHVFFWFANFNFFLF